MPPGVTTDFQFEISLDGGTTVVTTVPYGQLSALVTGRAPATTYQVAVRATDVFGNTSAWSAPISVVTLAVGEMPVTVARWLDVNGDGLADEVFDAAKPGDTGTPVFSHTIVAETTHAVNYTEWVQLWAHIPGYTYTTYSYLDDYARSYYVSAHWEYAWEEVSQLIDVKVVRPEFTTTPRDGYVYKVGRLITRPDGTSGLNEIYTINPDDTVGGFNHWFPTDFWAEAAYYTIPFVLARYNLAPGGCVLTLPGMDALTANKTNSTVTLANGTKITAGPTGATIKFPNGVEITIGTNGVLNGTPPTGVSHVPGVANVSLPGGITVNPGTGEVTIAGPAGLAGASVTVGGPGGLRVALPPGLTSIAGIIGKAVDAAGNILGIGTDPNKTKVDNGDGTWRDPDDLALGDVTATGTQTVRVGATDNDTRAPKPQNIITITFRMAPQIKKRVVDADTPTSDWGSAVEAPANQNIYAGDQNGDMVSWRVEGLPGVNSYAWSATGPQVVTGPAGSGASEWKIAIGGNDPIRQRLDWKPGAYVIKCRLTFDGGAIQDVQVSQDVGWRTDEYVVVGQVKPLNDITLSSERRSLLQANIVTDVAAMTFWGGALFYPPLEEATLAWFGAQVFATNGYSTLRTANFPDVGENERLWMIQHILNSNPDQFVVPDVFGPEVLFQLTQGKSYRMYSRVQFKYMIGPNGKILNPQAAPNSGVHSGPTKVTLPTTAVTAFNWITNGSGLPTLSLPAQIQIASETVTSPAFLFDRQGGRLAAFAGGRIGVEGRYAQYALFRRDAPYIFAETIFTLDADRRASQQTVRLSVDKVWSSTGTETGSRFFNEIRVFRRDYSDPAVRFRVVRILAFADNPGMLREFVLSLPLLTFPSAEPQPSVTTTP